MCIEVFLIIQSTHLWINVWWFTKYVCKTKLSDPSLLPYNLGDETKNILSVHEQREFSIHVVFLCKSPFLFSFLILWKINILTVWMKTYL